MTTQIPTSANSNTLSLIDTALFAINFAVAVLVFVSCVLSIAAADNPYSFLGGVCLVLPVLGYAVAEWVGWYRPRPSLSRPLGVLNLLAAVVLVLGGVGNVGAALRADEPRDLRFIVALGAGFGLAAAYLAYSGWRRLHHFAPSAPTQ